MISELHLHLIKKRNNDKDEHTWCIIYENGKDEAVIWN